METTPRVIRSVGHELQGQLNRGFARLVFKAHIERGFQRDFSAQARLHRIALVWLSLATVLIITVFDNLVFVLPPKLGSVALPLQVLVILPSMFWALAAAYNPKWLRFSESALLLAVSALIFSVLTMRAVGAGVGYDVPLEFTATAIAAVFFLGRVPFWRFLPWVALFCAALVLNERLLVGTDLEGWYRVIVNLVLITISIAGGYSFEYALRESWLNGRLLEQLSNQDPLTGIANRRAFQETAERGLRQAAREKKTLGVAMLDIDFFKPYNDNYGHHAGDICLQQVAEIIQSVAGRPLDCCARYGGEEFVIAWFDADAMQVQAIAESVLEKIRDLEIKHEYSQIRPVLTASMGLVTVVPEASTALEHLLDLADRAMYQAKQQGRDQIVVQHLRTEYLNAPSWSGNSAKTGGS